MKCEKSILDFDFRPEKVSEPSLKVKSGDAAAVAVKKENHIVTKLSDIPNVASIL